MQVRVDDDMRVILTLTSEEYGLLGGDKEVVAGFVEEEVEIALDAIRLDRMRAAGSDSAPSSEVEQTEPEIVVTTNAEFVVPAEPTATTEATVVTAPTEAPSPAEVEAPVNPEVMTE